MQTLAKIKGTCLDCGSLLYDSSCEDYACVESFRMAGACICTCNVMEFTACAVTEEIENCACEDGSPGQTFQVITGVRIGWGDAPAGYSLADIAALRCPEDPRVLYRLWGNLTGDDVVDPLCRKSTTLLQPLPITEDTFEVYDLVAEGISGGCEGGVIFISASAFGIETIPVEGAAPGTVSCYQRGGHEVLFIEATDTAGNTLVFCPFEGVTGTPFNCEIPPTFCCRYDIVSIAGAGCSMEGGEAIIEIAVAKIGDCTCPVEETYILDGIEYPLTEDFETVTHPVIPCSPGQHVTFVIRRIYGECSPPYNCPGGEFVQPDIVL